MNALRKIGKRTIFNGLLRVVDKGHYLQCILYALGTSLIDGLKHFFKKLDEIRVFESMF